jgi:PAS domain S-box-containing protein
MEKAKILYLEDNDLDVQLIKSYLDNAKIQYSLKHVNKRDEFINTLKDAAFDIILADYSLPTINGMEALAIVREMDKMIPFILISGTLGEEVAIESLKSGATDYVLKQNLKRFIAAFKRALEEAEKQRKLKQTEESLAFEKYLMSTFMDNIPDAIYFKDSESKFLRVNKAQAERMGLKNSYEAIGKSDFEFFDKSDAKITRDEENEVMNSGNVSTKEKERKNLVDGKTEWRLSTKLPLRNSDGLIFGTFGISRDITELKQAENKIKQDLHEKEILLTEIHHRVKNNLQVVSSLLHLQSQRFDDLQMGLSFQVAIKRIHSMALVHEKLYQSKDFSQINFSEYIELLGRDLVQTYTMDDKKIQMEYNLKDTFLGIDSAIPCGLLVNELVSNALKHAFPGDRDGKIYISFLRLEDESYQLIVRDDGIGIPDNINFDSTETLGMHLIDMLAKQIEGNVDLERKDGSTFTVSFMGYESAKSKYSKS